MEKKMFTIAVFTENQVGLLNLESVSSSPSAEAGVHKMNFLVAGEREVLEKVVKQIEKCVDVLKAFLYTDDEIVYQEVALYKVPTVRLLDEPNLERIIRVHNARILEITRDYTAVHTLGPHQCHQVAYRALHPLS